jgi:hypothetical protein
MVAKKDVSVGVDGVQLAQPGPVVPVLNELTEEALQLDPVTAEDGPVEDFHADWEAARAVQFKRSYIHQVAARSHHCVRGREAVSSQHLCSGTQCMAWRWLETDLEGFEEYGYCGLAGDPLQ